MPARSFPPIAPTATMGSTEFDAKLHLVTSYLLSPVQLAFVRSVIAVYVLVTLVFILVWEGTKTKDIDSFFSYFTNLTYIGICAYFLASGTQTILYAEISKAGQQRYPLQSWPQVLRCLHIFLLATITTFPILVTNDHCVLGFAVVVFDLCYTLLLYVTHSLSSRVEDRVLYVLLAWSNISKHAFNTAFALFEICFTNIEPNPWEHLIMTLVVLGAYLGLAYVTHATQGFYTYSFLDPSKGSKKLAIYIVGIAIGQCVVFILVNVLIYVRKRLTRRIVECDSPREKLTKTAVA
ncbi:hypothetical protein BJ912DRAFT_1147056 [Pholiota molesta]|nr:hypothetical protein BJ912DRAFT_1147056 [Pholiota molesta]